MFIGVDPGSTRTGIAVVDMDGNFVTADVVMLNSKWEHAIRKRVVFERIQKIIDQFNPSGAAVETTILGSHMNVESSRKLTEMAGVCVAALSTRYITVLRPFPQEWKNVVIGVSNANKDIIKTVMQQRIAMPDGYKEDAYDAAGMAEYARANITRMRL